MGLHQFIRPSASPSHAPVHPQGHLQLQQHANPSLSSTGSPTGGLNSAAGVPEQRSLPPPHTHTLTQHHGLRNLQDQFHRASGIAQSPRLPAITPHHLLSHPERALYTHCRDPVYCPPQCPSLLMGPGHFTVHSQKNSLFSTSSLQLPFTLPFTEF